MTAPPGVDSQDPPVTDAPSAPPVTDAPSAPPVTSQSSTRRLCADKQVSRDRDVHPLLHPSQSRARTCKASQSDKKEQHNPPSKE